MSSEPVLRERVSGGATPYLEQWVEQPLGDGWVAAFRLSWTGAEHIVVELRVVPDGENREAGEADFSGFEVLMPDVPGTTEPRDGLTARRVRGVRFDAVQKLMRKALERQIAESPHGEEIRRSRERARLRTPPKSRPATGARAGRWTDAEYARLAAQYAELVGNGVRNPVAVLAEKTRYSPARLRQALRHARQRGWLTETTRRRAGGRLTDQGVKILEGQQDPTG